MRGSTTTKLGKDLEGSDEVFLFGEFRKLRYVSRSTYHDDFVCVSFEDPEGSAGPMYLWAYSSYTVRPLPNKQGTVIVFDNGVSALRTWDGWLFSTVGGGKTYTDREMQTQLTGNEKIYNEGGHE